MINFWNIIGQNSGQLQVILNMIAIVLAFLAANYAMKQIFETRQQIEEGNRVSAYNLKLKILEIAYQCQNDIYDIESKFEVFKEKYETRLAQKGTSLSTFKLDNEHSIEEVFDIVLHLLDKPKEVIKIMIEQASSKDSNLDNNNLELYLHHLVSIKGSIFLSNQGLDRRIKDLEKILVH